MSTNSFPPLDNLRTEFESSKNTCTGDSFCQHYRFVCFLDKNYRGHPKFISAIEAAIRSVENVAQYRNDHRYVKLWLYVALRQKNPAAVFAYMKERKIGENVAFYHETYAKWTKVILNFTIMWLTFYQTQRHPI